MVVRELYSGTNVNEEFNSSLMHLVSFSLREGIPKSRAGCGVDASERQNERRPFDFGVLFPHNCVIATSGIP
jgi:hypothetical protein